MKPSIIIACKSERTPKEFSFLEGRDEFNLLYLSSGSDVIITFQENGNIALVLLESDLPDVNGYEITSALRKMDAHVPIILLVNYSNLQTFRLATLVGCSQLLQNPLTTEEVEAIVDKYIKLFNEKVKSGNNLISDKSVTHFL